MADGTKITLLPAAPANGWQTSGKLVGPATQRRDRNPISRSQKQPDSAVLEQATADVRMALEEAAMAATHAAQRALTSVTVLEEALVILEQAAGSVAPGPPALPRYGAVAFLSPREREV